MIFLSLSKKFVYFILFLIKVIFSNKSLNFKDYRNHSKLRILVNGPSLKSSLDQFKNEKKSNFEYLAVNFFPLQEEFYFLKPRYLCFADPMFFTNTLRNDEVFRLYMILNSKVSWQLLIFVPSSKFKAFLSFSKLNNSNIIIKPVNSTKYEGFDIFRNYFFKQNWAIVDINNVSNLAIFVGLNLNFRMIELYGLDHTFFDSLFVNDNNELCNKINHFYDENSVSMPVRAISSGEIRKISDYTLSISNMFRSHDLLNNYANYLHVLILNCTKNSLVDSYPRKII